MNNCSYIYIKYSDDKLEEYILNAFPNWIKTNESETNLLILYASNRGLNKFYSSNIYNLLEFKKNNVIQGAILTSILIKHCTSSDVLNFICSDKALYKELPTSFKWTTLGLFPFRSQLIELLQISENNDYVDNLAGRELEINKINKELERKSSSFITIIGEPGIGKTAIHNYLKNNSKESSITSITLYRVLTTAWWEKINKGSFNNSAPLPPESIALILKTFYSQQINQKTIVFDDYQWADLTTRRIVNELITSNTKNLNIIFFSRHLQENASLVKSSTLHIPLRGLSTNHVKKLVKKKHIHSNFNIDLLVKNTGGNPLLINEYISNENNLPQQSHQLDKNFSTNLILESNLKNHTLKIRSSLRLLAEISSSFSPSTINELHNELDYFCSLEKLKATNLVEPTESGLMIFKHDLIRNCIIETIDLYDEPYSLSTLAFILEKNKDFSSSARLYNTLNKWDKAKKMYVRQITDAFNRNEFSSCIKHCEQVKEIPNINNQNEFIIIEWHHGCSHSVLGELEKAHSMLESSLIGFGYNYSPFRSAIQLAVLLLPLSKKRTTRLSKKEFFYKNQACQSLKYLAEYDFITSNPLRCLISSIHCYKLEYNLKSENKYYGDGSLMLPLIVYSCLSKKVGKRMICKELRSIKKHGNRSEKKYKFILIHYKMGTHRWITQKKQITSCYNDADSDLNQKGKLGLELTIWLLQIGDILNCFDHAYSQHKLMNRYQQSWLENSQIIFKSLCLCFLGKAPHALFNLQKIEDPHLDKVPYLHLVMSLAFFQLGKHRKALHHIQKATTNQALDNAVDHTMATISKEIILLLNYYHKQSPNFITKSKLKRLRRTLQKKSKTFVAFLPSFHLLEYMRLKDENPELADKHIFLSLNFSKKYHYARDFSFVSYVHNATYTSEALFSGDKNLIDLIIHRSTTTNYA